MLWEPCASRRWHVRMARDVPPSRPHRRSSRLRVRVSGLTLPHLNGQRAPGAKLAETAVAVFFLWKGLQVRRREGVFRLLRCMPVEEVPDGWYCLILAVCCLLQQRVWTALLSIDQQR